MGFRGEMDDGVRFFLDQQAGHQRSVADVAFHEPVVWMLEHVAKAFHVARVSELVQVDDLRPLRGQLLQHEIGPDESRAARHE